MRQLGQRPRSPDSYSATSQIIYNVCSHDYHARSNLLAVLEATLIEPISAIGAQHQDAIPTTYEIGLTRTQVVIVNSACIVEAVRADYILVGKDTPPKSVSAADMWSVMRG